MVIYWMLVNALLSVSANYYPTTVIYLDDKIELDLAMVDGGYIVMHYHDNEYVWHISTLDRTWARQSLTSLTIANRIGIQKIRISLQCYNGEYIYSLYDATSIHQWLLDLEKFHSQHKPLLYATVLDSVWNLVLEEFMHTAEKITCCNLVQQDEIV